MSHRTGAGASDAAGSRPRSSSKDRSMARPRSSSKDRSTARPRSSSKDRSMAEKEKRRQAYIDSEFKRRDTEMKLTRAQEDLKEAQQENDTLRKEVQDREKELDRQDEMIRDLKLQCERKLFEQDPPGVDRDCQVKLESANKELAETAAQLQNEKEFRKRDQDWLDRAKKELAEKDEQCKKEKDRANSLQTRAEIAEKNLQDLHTRDRNLQAELAAIKLNFRELGENKELLAMVRKALHRAQTAERRRCEMEGQIARGAAELEALQKEVETLRKSKEIPAQDLPTQPGKHDIPALDLPISPRKQQVQNVVGLPNLGNTCYMNAALQCLANTPGIREQVWLPTGNCKSDASIRAARFGVFMESYVSKSPNLRNALEGLRDSLSVLNPAFKAREEHHDAHEALSFLLSGFEDAMEWVKRAFTLKLKVEHKCLRCYKHSSKPKEAEDRSVRLPLTSGKTSADEIDALGEVSVQELINSHMCCEELISGVIDCQHCGRNAEGFSSVTTLSSSGDILVVHLLRFDSGYDARGDFRPKKVCRHVQLQSEITLPKGAGQAGPGPKYRLHGIANHVGLTASRGHYVAVVKDLVTKQWIYCDDSHVSLTKVAADGLPDIDPEKESPYLLFYHRVK